MHFHNIVQDFVDAHYVEGYFIKLESLLFPPLPAEAKHWLITNCRKRHFMLEAFPILKGTLPGPLEDYVFIVRGKATETPPLNEKQFPACDCLLYAKNGLPYLYRYIP